MWKTRDESNNFPQKHDTVLIKEAKRVEVETEVRVQVDELMREELNNLKMVIFVVGLAVGIHQLSKYDSALQRVKKNLSCLKYRR